MAQAAKAQPAELYRAIGGAAGCRALAKAFYARVERDLVLRPLFPSTFTCAIEEFSAFLVQFLGGPAEHTQRRWWLSLRESHHRFSLGPRERSAWLRAMTATLSDESAIADAAVRRDLLEFFRRSSAHLVNHDEVHHARVRATAAPLDGELAELWEEQLALDQAVALLRARDIAGFVELFEGPALQARFARSPAVHASLLALAAKSGVAGLREFCADRLHTHPSLIREHYNFGRTLLHDAAAGGEVALAEQILAMGAEPDAENSGAPSPLYCVANECSAPGASRIVRMLLERGAARVNAIHGVKRCTALHMAARRGNVEVIEALLDCGAEIEARDSAGDTPLRRAVNCNRVEAAIALLARGADPRSQGSKARTPAQAARSDSMRRLFVQF